MTPDIGKSETGEQTMKIQYFQNYRHTAAPLGHTYQLIIEGLEYHGEIAHISVNGGFFSLPKQFHTALRVGKTGTVHLQINGQTLGLSCEIVYIDATDTKIFPNGIGVVFAIDDDKDLATLEDLVSKANGATPATL